MALISTWILEHGFQFSFVDVLVGPYFIRVGSNGHIGGQEKDIINWKEIKASDP